MILFFSKERTSPIQENCLKSSIFLLLDENIGRFTPIDVHGTNCIRFHSYRTRFKGSGGRFLPEQGLAGRLFPSHQLWRKSIEEMPLWRPCYIISCSRDYLLKRYLRQSRLSYSKKGETRF